MSVKSLTKPVVQQFLYETAGRVGPGNYVELGCYIGGSAIFIANGIKDSGVDAHLITVDAFTGVTLKPRFANTYSIESVRETFEVEGVSDLVTPVKGLTAEVAAAYQDKEFAFLFIDADHTYEGCKADFEAWSPLIKSGGEIAFHDNNLEYVQKVLSEIPWNSYSVANTEVFVKP